MKKMMVKILQEPVEDPSVETIYVSVANGKFVLYGEFNLQVGKTYVFDQRDPTNSGHPFRLSTTSDGTHAGGEEYNQSVTTEGTPGTNGAYTAIIVTEATPKLFYYCAVHSGMGNSDDDVTIQPVEGEEPVEDPSGEPVDGEEHGGHDHDSHDHSGY